MSAMSLRTSAYFTLCLICFQMIEFAQGLGPPPEHWGPDQTLTTIKEVHFWPSGAYSGAVHFEVDHPAPSGSCPGGYWILPSDTHFDTIVKALMSKKLSGEQVFFGGNSQQDIATGWGTCRMTVVYA